MSKTKSKRANQWPSIYRQKNRSGQYSYYVDLRAVGGGRPAYSTEQEAKARAEQARIQKGNEGVAAFSLPDFVRVDAARAYQILAPHNVTILEAARYYDKHVLAYKSAPPVKEIVNLYIDEAIANNRRPKTISDLKSRLLNGFATDFGERKLSEITSDELREWVTDDGWEPQTRINYLTKISQLYIFAMNRQNKWVDSNITELISRPDVDETIPQVYSVEEAERLLLNAEEFNLLPYVAIGLFAGVRMTEMMRLDSKDINFDTKTIRIGPDVAKKRSQRMIDMEPALLAWLEPYKEKLKEGFDITGSNFQRDRNGLVESAGLVEWKPNGLRHTYGTNHLAMFRDDGETAHQMGNSIEVVHKHYKGLVSKEIAEQFWNLRPPQN